MLKALGSEIVEFYLNGWPVLDVPSPDLSARGIAYFPWK
jgi:hypothetical protein